MQTSGAAAQLKNEMSKKALWVKKPNTLLQKVMKHFLSAQNIQDKSTHLPSHTENFLFFKRFRLTWTAASDQSISSIFKTASRWAFSSAATSKFAFFKLSFMRLITSRKLSLHFSKLSTKLLALETMSRSWLNSGNSAITSFSFCFFVLVFCASTKKGINCWSIIFYEQHAKVVGPWLYLQKNWLFQLFECH